MPGRFFLTTPMAEVAERLGKPAGDLEDEPPRQNIQPGQEIVVLTAQGLTRMRWGMIPVGRVNARGRPVMETIINARSETVFDKSAFDGVGRAVIPVDGWYEWTGEKRRKTPWRLSAKDGQPLYFAAITDVWTAPGGLQVPQAAAVTCDPNADVKPIHHRMGVILPVDDVQTWLSEDEGVARKLMRPLPNGLLNIREAVDVNWSGP
ncbi:Putative SOS response-associated peptidase YedK [Falsiruegeria litorea R37]|uniref:Abasic site processing protein n=1 Tax=Falsiruegeria litorea R37 TaxID=1200284 RepID=A0A1Y5TM20_9RHOB|nr:SOS response-associated peptidase [Falsiruegeria litorea]SLN67069.1 Putative SOS response-associated peptidase YedK [Falsiruegeria litorea R37]